MRHPLAAGLALLLLAACGQKAEEKKAGPPPALITVTQVGSGEFEVVAGNPGHAGSAGRSENRRRSRRAG
jgi:predicted outer membrane protein